MHPIQPVRSQTESIRPLLLLFVAVLVLMITVALALVTLVDSWEKRGQFGDMFGVANTLFSGMAFAALAFALNLQRKELSLQREELALTRAELEKQSQAQAAHAATALLAARISALGSLLQGYSTMWAANRHNLVGDDPVGEFRRVQAELKQLLQQADA